METIRVEFARPKHIIKSYPLMKKAYRTTLKLPYGAQILYAEDQSHNGTLMVWVLESLDPTLLKTNREIVVTQENVPFDLEPGDHEVEGLDSSSPLFFANHLGSWVDHIIDASGMVAITGHVLEIYAHDCEYDEEP